MNREELKMLQALPLEAKILKSQQRIREWVDFHGPEKCYVAYSGGKDSTVVLDLVRKTYPDIEIIIPPVFSDTGLEFPELRSHAAKQKDIVIIKPTMTFKDVVQRYGYPIISKRVAQNLYKVKEQNLSERYRNYLLNGDERGNYDTIPKRWVHLKDSDFKIGGGCCDAMKKRPFKAYEKESGRNASITGEMAEESLLRTRQYLVTGCNAFERKSGAKSMPIGFWTQNDVLQYIYENNLEIPSVYGEIYIDSYRELSSGEKLPIFKTTGVNRTGCVFCAFGVQTEPADDNRFLQLQQSHPQLHKHCIGGGTYNEEGKWIPHKGLGMGHVLDAIGVKHTKGGNE